MNSLTMVSRLIWKDLRAIFPLGLLLVAFMGLSIAFDRVFPEVASSLLAQSLPLICGTLGLATGLILFSLEVETGTIGLFQRLPISSRRLVYIKWTTGLLVTVGGSAMVSLLLWLSLPVFAGHYLTLHADDWLTFWLPVSLLIALQLFTWSSLLSTLRVNIAFTIIGAIFCLGFTYSFLHDLWVNQSGTGNPASFIYVVAFTATAMAALTALGLLWTHPRFVDNREVFPSGLKRFFGTRLERASRGASGGKRLFTSLLWQTVRQSWTVMLLTFVVVTVASVLVRWYMESIGEFTILIGGLLLMPALASGLIFSNDHERWQHHFFIQHPVSGRWIWLARVLPWIGIVVAAGLLAQFALLPIGLRSVIAAFEPMVNPAQTPLNRFGSNRPFAISWNLMMHPLQVIHFLLLTVACGQLCSLIFRNTVIAVGAAAFTSVAGLCYWLGVTYLGEPASLFVLPLALAILCIGAWYARYWIQGSANIKTIAVAVTLVAIASGAQITSLVRYRAYQFPDLGNSFSFERPALPPDVLEKLTPIIRFDAGVLNLPLAELKQQFAIDESESPPKLELEQMNRSKIESLLDSENYRRDQSTYRKMVYYYLAWARVMAESGRHGDALLANATAFCLSDSIVLGFDSQLVELLERETMRLVQLGTFDHVSPQGILEIPDSQRNYYLGLGPRRFQRRAQIEMEMGLLSELRSRNKTLWERLLTPFLIEFERTRRIIQRKDFFLNPLLESNSDIMESLWLDHRYVEYTLPGSREIRLYAETRRGIEYRYRKTGEWPETIPKNFANKNHVYLPHGHAANIILTNQALARERRFLRVLPAGTPVLLPNQIVLESDGKTYCYVSKAWRGIMSFELGRADWSQEAEAPEPSVPDESIQDGE